MPFSSTDLAAPGRRPNAGQFTPAQWLAVFAGFALLALLVMSWRWGGTVEDSQAYFDTARYLRGELPFSELRAPFPYRVLVPAMASVIPGDLRNGFAGLNWALIAGAAAVMALTVVRLGYGRGRAVAAGLLLIVSVPTFWYAPYLLVDPGSIFARAVFVFAVLSGQPWLAAAAGVVGTAVREENIVLLFWLLAMRQIPFMPGLAALAAAGAWIVSVRWWLMPGLPGYVWEPSVHSIVTNMTNPRTLASLATAAGIVVPLALLGWRRMPARLKPLKSLLLLLVLPPLYAALSVRIDGRAIWSLYPLLVPMAVSVGLRRTKKE